MWIGWPLTVCRVVVGLEKKRRDKPAAVWISVSRSKKHAFDAALAGILQILRHPVAT